MEKKGRFVVDDTYGCCLLLASIYKRKKRDIVLLSSNLYQAQKTYEFLLNFVPEEDIVFFPNDELLRAESLSSGQEVLAQRLYAMASLLGSKGKILVTCPSGLLRYLPSPEQFEEATIKIAVGSSYDLNELKMQLVRNGYEHVSKVEHSLQFANRGDIIDVFPVSSSDPLRIEFFGDEIESIRAFKVQDQESKQKLDECVIPPATDMLLSDDELANLTMRAKAQLEKDCEKKSFSERDQLESYLAEDIENLLNSHFKPGLYRYFGYARKEPVSIIDYLHPELILVPSKDKFLSSVGLLRQDAANYFEELVEEGRIISHLEEYMPLEKAIKDHSKVVVSETYSNDPGDFVFQARGIVSVGVSLNSVVPTIETYVGTCNKTVICLPDSHQRETVTGLLESAGIEYEKVDSFELPKGRVGISASNLNEGFEIPSLKIAFISSNDLFGRNPALSRYTARFKNATILKSYEDLHPGDYVVHEYNGIGQYLGIKTIETNGIHRDYLNIVYAKKETLYVPLEQFRLVRKYAGREGVAPKLSNLSSGEWEKKKKTIKERVNQMAGELQRLYEERAKQPGYAFPPDDDLQKAFESQFSYKLTDDQQKSLDEIKKDMESPIIMDRLLCGDVGFGKTEVAFRAAFKAINGGKQVALLCPTTLLARQHFEVAARRFADFGIRIVSFSRLIPMSEQRAEMTLVEEGKADLIIGTHRLLSKDIKFKDLGLLIVDEEQRFGVAQKEKITNLKRNVDVLTLSATPIPRTLQMSLVGMRQLSQINSAPTDRMPIQTYVTPYKEAVVDELISRELSRDGQVFYVFNRVDIIYNKASSLAKRIPGAKIGVVHGQMEKDEIEIVMNAFYEGRVNVLVCTSIVENGIDVPNANMIIVEDADYFGLSQLYQIKGRVGRGNRIAYAYLMYKEQKALNEDAQKRLQAIREFTELGSGYKIAQRDLMIRGAGDILGPEQAGFIDSIGLDLYLKMLNEAVEERRTGIVKPPVKPNKLFQLDAYIPMGYAENSDKIELYQELDSATDEEGVKRFQKKIRDIYGRIPEETKALIQKKRIDLLLEEPEFSSISDDDKRVDLMMNQQFSNIGGIGQALFNELVPFLDMLTVSFINKRLRIVIAKGKDWLSDLENIVRSIHDVYVRSAR